MKPISGVFSYGIASRPPTLGQTEADVRERDQVMTKMRLRRLIEEMLDADLVAVDVEEDEENHADQPRPVKRVSLVVRYLPA